MSPNSAVEDGNASFERPREVAVAAVLCAVEGAVAAGLGILMLALLALGRADDVKQAAAGAVTVLVLAALPLAAARGMWLLRRWSRGPAVTVQVMAVPTGWFMISAGGAWPVAGAALLAAALTVLGCLVTPAAVRALTATSRQP